MSKILKLNEFIGESFNNKVPEFLKENVENTNPNQITFGFEQRKPFIKGYLDIIYQKENTISFKIECGTEGIVKDFGKFGTPLKTYFGCTFNVTFLGENIYDITLEKSSTHCYSSESLKHIDITKPSYISSNICFGGVNNIENYVLNNTDTEQIENLFDSISDKSILKIANTFNIFPPKETLENILNDCLTKFSEFIKETIEKNLNE